MCRRLLVCCALLAAIACGAASAVGPTDTPLSGTWTLRTLNDAALPYALPESPNGYPTTVLGATLILSGTGSGSYTERIEVRVVTPVQTTDTSVTFSGTWAVNGASITFNDPTYSEVDQGSIVNGTIAKVVLFGYSGEYAR